MALTARYAGGEVPTATKMNETGVAVVSSTSDISAPYAGQVVMVTTGNNLWYYTGSAWRPYSSLIGSESVRTSPSAGFTTTEVILDSITVLLVSGVTYRITWDTQFGTSTGTSSTTAFERIRAQIREDDISGTVIATRDCCTIMGGGVSHPVYLQAKFTAASTGNKTFVATGDRHVGSGTITSYGDTISPVFFRVEAP
jgi:hypothetical protein